MDESALVIQRVTTTWTKASRGGAGAARRNACPVGFAIEAGLGWSQWTMNERDDFVPEVESSSTVPSGVAEELGLRMRDGRISVLPQIDAFSMPKRWRRPPRASIGSSEWLRWTFNSRYGLDNGWAYRLTTWNVALGLDPGDSFLGTPNRYIEEMATLR